MVVEKDGVRYEHARPVPQTQVDQKETSSGEKELTIKLRNGKVFNGTRISETEKLIVLKSNGIQLNIFKNIISEIDSGTGSAANLPDVQPVEIKQENDQRAAAIQVQQSGAQVQLPQALPSLPEEKRSPETPKKESIPAAKKGSDGRIEIVLKDGMSFTGKITSENEKFISFNSDGAQINIVKRLIKEIDGIPYKKVSGSSNAENDFQRRRTAESDSDGHGEEVGGERVLKRALPATALPQDLSVLKISSTLKSTDWKERSNACRILGGMGQWASSAIASLVEILSDTAGSQINVPVWIDSTEVNELLPPGFEAARALALMGQEGFNQLREALKQSNPLIRKHAAFGLCELSTQGALNLLKELLQDANPQVRAVAVGGFRFSSTLDQLLIASKDADMDVRANAAFMIGRLEDRRALDDLINLLGDKRASVRVNAAEAAGKLGCLQVVDPLIKALKDENPLVRKNAAVSLGLTKDAKAVLPLIELLKDEDATVRTAVVKTLTSYRDPQSIPPLYGMLKDKEPEIRSLAEEAVKLHTEIPLLILTLDDKSPMVRENVTYLLWLMTGQDLGQDKAQWQSWYAGDRKETKAKK